MSMTSFADRREVHRIRRWLETAGASWRLLTPVCTSPALRETVLDGVSAGGKMRLLPVDIRDGDVIPASFRDYRGTHTSFTLFSFDGLADRVRRDGLDVLKELDAGHMLFERPATWALIWLDDAALLPLIAHHAPRFHQRIELHPTFAESTLFAPRSDEPLLTHIAAIANEGRNSYGGELGARILLQRADLAGARTYLRKTALDPESWLLLQAAIAGESGDTYAALTHLATACTFDGARRAEACAEAAELMRRFGDVGGAVTLSEEAIADTAPPTARLRANVTRARLGRDTEDALDRATDAAGDDPSLNLELGLALRGLAPKRAAAALRRASSLAATDPILSRQVRSHLAVSLLETDASEAEPILAELIGSSDPESAVRARCGLARLALRRATHGRDDADVAALDEADTHLDSAVAMAKQNALVRAHIDALWDRVAVAAAREDLGRILAWLGQLERVTADAGLQVARFDVLVDQARALRHARELADAAGKLDELTALGLDLALPELERRALTARADHLNELGAKDDARKLYGRAADLAAGVGDHETAESLRALAS